MKESAARLIIRGARGTMPACGRAFWRYGGNTTCFSLRTPEGLLVLDAGTGLAHLAAEIEREPAPPPITLLFSHLHMDHVIGLPAFAPLYHPASRFTIMADPRRGNWKQDLRTFIARPYWPVGIGDSDAAMRLEDLPADQGDAELCGVRVSWFAVPHPQGCLAYRLERDGVSCVVATDTEYTAETLDPAFIHFIRGADYLLFDAQYAPEEYAARRGWGHSTWQTAVRAARSGQVRRLVLIHHAPERTDAGVAALLAAARREFPATFAAREGLRLDAAGPDETGCDVIPEAAP